MTYTTKVDLDVRADAQRELDRLRQPIIDLFEAVRDLDNARDSLEWSLWATNPEVERQHFNQQYGDKRFEHDLPVFRERLTKVIAVIEESWG